MGNVPMTIEELRDLLVKAIAVEASILPGEVSTDQPFTSYGLDSMAALTVGMEIEECCGLSDLPVSLIWDYPTLADTLWQMMSSRTALTSAEDQ